MTNTTTWAVVSGPAESGPRHCPRTGTEPCPNVRMNHEKEACRATMSMQEGNRGVPFNSTSATPCSCLLTPYASMLPRTTSPSLHQGGPTTPRSQPYLAVLYCRMASLQIYIEWRLARAHPAASQPQRPGGACRGWGWSHTGAGLTRRARGVTQESPQHATFSAADGPP